MTDIDVDALAPCPFCGGEAILFADDSGHGEHRVGCTSCSMDGGPIGKTEIAAIAAWNTRAQAAPAPDDVREAVTLADCPPGLFLFNGSLGFKTVCGAMRGAIIPGGKVKWEVTHWPDAYCVESGDNFWGGAITHEDRAQLMVQPIADAAIAAMRGRATT